MKRFRLTRRWCDDERTIGELTCDQNESFHAFTLEPGWNDHEAPRVSAGFYLLQRHGWEPDSPAKFKQTWALVGENVSHQPQIKVKRSAVLIHPGNFDEHTTGCVLLGESIGYMANEPAVVNSRATVAKLRDLVGEADACLVIRGD